MKRTQMLERIDEICEVENIEISNHGKQLIIDFIEILVKDIKQTIADSKRSRK